MATRRQVISVLEQALMEALPLRLVPGNDLCEALEAEVAKRSCRAAFVLSAIGSLAPARLRFADASAPTTLSGHCEILSLAGTIAANGSHLHMSVADATGQVLGGHVAHGSMVHTTVEALLLLLPEWSFTRKLDDATGFAELVANRGGPRDA
jgi:uncharacterized protein